MVPKLIGCACSQPQIMKSRSKIVPQADGDVFELGCGGGINMEFYDPTRINSYAGLDPSPALLDRSREAAQAKGSVHGVRREWLPGCYAVPAVADAWGSGADATPLQ